MKAIILARVSTKEQEETGHSLPAQVESLQSYAEKKNFDVVKTFSFSESAGPKIRKKFEEVLEYIRRHKDVRVLLCENVDRATRNFRDAVDLDNLRRDEGLEIHFVKDGFFINRDATGNQMFMWEAKVFIGKQYLNRLSDDVKRSIWQRFEDHHWPGKAPHGYKNDVLSDGVERTIVPDDNESHLIIRMFELYATGTYSYKSLSRSLYDLGLKSSRGTPLWAAAIEHILNNPFYYGVMRYKGHENTHDYEPLITKALFDQCQRVRTRWNKQPFTYAAKPMAFRGIITCKNCGCAISGEIKKKRLVYYSCTNYRKKCQRVYLREETLLKPIYPVLEGIQMTDQRIKEITEGMKQLGESEHQFHGDSMHGLKREYDERGEEIYKAYKDQLAGRITQEMYDRLVLENKTRQAEILEKMGKHNAADKTFYITANRIFNAIKRGCEVFEGSEPEEKREFLNMLLQNATLDGKKLDFKLRSPFDTMYETRNEPIGLPELDAFRTIKWQEIEESLAPVRTRIAVL